MKVFDIFGVKFVVFQYISSGDQLVTHDFHFLFSVLMFIHVNVGVSVCWFFSPGLVRNHLEFGKGLCIVQIQKKKTLNGISHNWDKIEETV